jgi:hypothetical protein
MQEPTRSKSQRERGFAAKRHRKTRGAHHSSLSGAFFTRRGTRARQLCVVQQRVRHGRGLWPGSGRNVEWVETLGVGAAWACRRFQQQLG